VNVAWNFAHESSNARLDATPDEVALFNNAKNFAERYQDGPRQYMHFMTGPTTPEEAKDMANAWIGFNLLKAWDYGDADRQMSLFHAGLAIHAAQDFTSPTHTDTGTRLPKLWNPVTTWTSLPFLVGTAIPHALGETYDPGPESNLQYAGQDVLNMYRARMFADVDRMDFSSRWGVDAPGAPIIKPSPIVRPASRGGPRFDVVPASIPDNLA
jgi:hypothetical protein